MSRFRTYNPSFTTSRRAFSALPMHAPAPAGGVQRFGNSHTDHCLLFSIPWIYTFSAKEKDSETGFSYFGSRYYNSDLSIWLSVDPMASKYPSQSNYVYCSNNPIKVIDPNGEDEYFNEYGFYLGSDNSESNNVRMITQNDWDFFKNVNEDDMTESISSDFGTAVGSLISESDPSVFSNDAILGVYQHFGLTEGFDINTIKDAATSNKDFGRGTDEFNMAYNNISGNLYIPITEMRKKSLYNNLYNIKNCFAHEKGHQMDKNTPLDQKKLREINAINYQISSSSWPQTTKEYKQQIYKNLKHWNFVKQ